MTLKTLNKAIKLKLLVQQLCAQRGCGRKEEEINQPFNLRPLKKIVPNDNYLHCKNHTRAYSLFPLTLSSLRIGFKTAYRFWGITAL